MKTEEEVRSVIDHLEEALHDHHRYLNEPHVIEAVLSTYSHAIRLLKWVVGDEVLPLESTTKRDEDG